MNILAMPALSRCFCKLSLGEPLPPDQRRIGCLDHGQLSLQAIQEVERIGAEVICIVDRLEGARERLTPRYNYMPVFTVHDLGVEAGIHE
jgi:hypothetical protein